MKNNLPPSQPQNRALSIRQPYAEQIMRGVKTIEYRSILTHIRGRVYIYASLTPGPREPVPKNEREPGRFPDRRNRWHRLDCRLLWRSGGL